MRSVWIGVLLLAGSLSGQAGVFAAETSDPTVMATTQVLLQLDTPQAVAVRTKFHAGSSTLTVEFPRQHVMANLPEHVAVEQGVIKRVSARYEKRAGTDPQRYLASVQVQLTAPFAYQVASAPGSVAIDIKHPASIHSASLELGLRGGTVISGIARIPISERFRAMQSALADASSSVQAPPRWSATNAALTTSPVRVTAQWIDPAPRKAAPAQVRTATPRPLPQLKSGSLRRAVPATAALILLLLAVPGAVAGLFWWLSRIEGAWATPTEAAQAAARVASGVLLIDELVWRAFERQGYELVIESERAQAPRGTLRVIAKEGVKSALLFVGHGPFFEKQTVEGFVQAMRDAGVDQGFLVASGSFTVPAQRLAKAHQITLLGRDQVTELLSVGARSEYFAKQLEQQQGRLEEAKETLRQYANELDTLRRQRNEASWHLGEERAKTAKLAADIEQFEQQLQRQDIELKKWQEEAATLRQQWQESEWYLGESRAHAQHLQTQLEALKDAAQRVEQLERERSESVWHLGQEQATREAMERQLVELQISLDDAGRREKTLRDQIAELRAEFSQQQERGERRDHVRKTIAEAMIEVFNGSETPLFSGSPRDIGRGGIGLELDAALPVLDSMHVRLALPGLPAVEAGAQIAWQQPSGAEPLRYRAGIQFTDLSAAASRRIEKSLSAATVKS